MTQLTEDQKDQVRKVMDLKKSPSTKEPNKLAARQSQPWFWQCTTNQVSQVSEERRISLKRIGEPTWPNPKYTPLMEKESK